MEPDAFKLGAQAARAGDFQTASTYFMQVVKANPNSEKGWLYLGHCLTDRGKRISCYERVLKINPYNQEAQKALTDLGQFYYPPGGISQELYAHQPEPEYPAAAKNWQTPAPSPAKPRKSSKRNTLLSIAGGLVACVGIVCLGLWLLTKLPYSNQASPPPTAAVTHLPGIDAALLPAPLASTGAGRVCLGFWRNGGVACLDENGWQIYTTENSELPDALINSGAFCPDGRLVIAHSDGFSLVRDQQWEQIPLVSEEFGPANDLACDQENHLWAAHYKGVSRYMDGAWQTFGTDLLMPGVTATKLDELHVVAAPDGTIWVVTPHSVARFANEAWTVFQAGQGFTGNPIFTGLSLDATGRPWVGYKNGIAVYDHGSWKQFANGGPNVPEKISLDARGHVWISTPFQGLAVFDGQTWTVYSHETQSLPGNKINALATDTLGRVWVGTIDGLAVFDGAQWLSYTIDNSDLPDNQVIFVTLEKDGPSLPAPTEKPKGRITGQFPLRYKRVELCAEFVTGTFTGETPCAGKDAFHLVTTTDEAGNFAFENVPAGSYYLYAETNNGWAKLTETNSTDYRKILVNPGEQYDLGELNISQ